MGDGQASKKQLEQNKNPTADLVNEIVSLEHEVIQLERHLLSLYRTTFDQYMSGSSSASLFSPRSSSSSERRSSASTQTEKRITKAATYLKDVKTASQDDDNKSVQKIGRIKHNSDYGISATPKCRKDSSIFIPGHCSLANFLSASIAQQMPDISYKLSRDIIRCISSVYSKLTAATAPKMNLTASSTTSLSSSSTISINDRHKRWSPRCHYESPRLFGPTTDANATYSEVMVVSKIHINADSFSYASKTLKVFRSLILRLEKVNPTEMDHEKQLSFWINIHNALVMHAYLAYGLHDKQMRSSDMILKATYNVGGQSVNAQIIQSLILGCQTHQQSVWKRMLSFSTKSPISGATRHPYALPHPEPLAHFALSVGLFSDPPVRVYSAKQIHKELEIAKMEYIEANVQVRKQKILLPKLLYCYGKDAALELRDIVEMVHDCIPDRQQKDIQRCLTKGVDKCVEWLPYKSTFRYILKKESVN